MSNDNLILHLSLAGISDNNRVPNSADQANHGLIKGNPQMVPDETFGSCLNFDGVGNYVEVADNDLLKITGDITIAAWVYITAEIGNWVRIIGKGGATDRNYGLWYHVGEKQWLFQQYGQGPTADVRFVADNIELHTWYHVAGVLAGDQAFLYVNGQQVATQRGLTGVPHTSSDPLTLGYDDHHAQHQGRIAHARVYRRALSAADIQRNMETDQTALAAFRKSYPLEFDLRDEDDQNVLYISDHLSGRNLTLEISNVSPQVIEARALPEPPKDESASAYFQKNHQFELRFRPHTLSQTTVGSAAAPSPLTLGERNGWRMSQPHVNDNGTVSLYFLSTTAQNLDPQKRIILPLQHLNAAAGGGSRGTRVELRYQALHAGGDQIPALTGYRVRHVNIINHRGRKHIPLHVGFVGSNAILNDGASTNALTLRITNTLEDGVISLSPAGSDAPSRLILSADCGDANEEWGLATTSQINGIDVRILNAQGQPDPNWLIEKTGAEGACPAWVMTTRDTRLAAGQHLQIHVSGLVSSLPTGQANMYLRYENIPGYWAGQFVVTVEKSPLVTRQERVGIGTVDPRTALDTGLGVMSGAANDYQKAQFTMSGGGIISWAGPGGRLKWTQRFLAISMERSQTFATGHMNIVQPTTNIPAHHVYDGKARSATAEGVVLHRWDALYAVHTVGGNQEQVEFRIVNYTHPFSAPSNWLLVAVVNGDDETVKLGTGTIVVKESALTEGSELPLGAIIMWSGATIPAGWALCNGQTVNGFTTPDLRGRFIVGFSPDDGHYSQPGNHSERGTVSGQIGGAATVALSEQQMPNHNHSGHTAASGGHHHWMEGTAADGLARRQRTIWGQTTVDMGFGGGHNADPNDVRWRGHVNTDTAPNHSHTFTTSHSGLGHAHENRPPYYVLAFIMKV